MSEYVLYHNPRCSKSRAALGLLQTRGVETRVVHYLETPPDAAALRAVVDALGVPARALLRTGEDDYGALGLGDPALDDARAIAAMVAYPNLIERPILVHGDRAVIGRPPERVLELVDSQG